MKLSIIILNFYTRNLVELAVKYIKQTVKETSYEIIVVDNGTKDGVDVMLAEQYPDVVFLQTGKNLGYSGGNNAGVNIAKGEFILILNPDIFCMPGSVDGMVTYLESHPDIGLLVPQLLNGDKSVQLSCRRFQTIKSVVYRRTPLGLTKSGKAYLDKFLMNDIDHTQIQDVDWAIGACFLFKKSYFKELGMLDERFALYVEDLDICRRVWMSGKRVTYYPPAKLIHLHEQASATSPWAFVKVFSHKLTRWHVVSYLKYLLKYWNNNNYGSRTKLQ